MCNLHAKLQEGVSIYRDKKLDSYIRLTCGLLGDICKYTTKKVWLNISALIAVLLTAKMQKLWISWKTHGKILRGIEFRDSKQADTDFVKWGMNGIGRASQTEAGRTQRT